jgi:hypothetical protein
LKDRTVVTRKQIVLGNTAEEIMFYNAIEMAKELAEQEMIDMELFDTYTAYTVIKVFKKASSFPELFFNTS